MRLCSRPMLTPTTSPAASSSVTSVECGIGSSLSASSLSELEKDEYWEGESDPSRFEDAVSEEYNDCFCVFVGAAVEALSDAGWSAGIETMTIYAKRESLSTSFKA